MAERAGNIRLSRGEVEQAIREHVIRLEKARGRDVGFEPIDFHNRALVQFVDAQNTQVPLPFDSVVVGRKE